MDTPSLIKRAYNLGLKAVPNFTALSEEQIGYYENHLDELPEALSRGFVMPSKFELLVDLGVIEVPKGYVHRTRLATFKARYQNDKIKSFYYYNDAITDEHFPNPSRILKPGDRLHVCAYRQVASGTTTSKERMDYLVAQGMPVYTGAQGASLVFEQKRDQLPKGKWYASFDEEDRLWGGAGGRRRVPYVCARSGGDFDFDLGSFGYPWAGDSAFLGFRDLEALEA